MRNTDAGLLIGLTFGKMAYIGVTPGIYRFATSGTETRAIETGFATGATLTQGSELEIYMAQILDLYQQAEPLMSQEQETEMHAT